MKIDEFLSDDFVHSLVATVFMPIPKIIVK